MDVNLIDVRNILLKIFLLCTGWFFLYMSFFATYFLFLGMPRIRIHKETTIPSGESSCSSGFTHPILLRIFLTEFSEDIEPIHIMAARLTNLSSWLISLGRCSKTPRLTICALFSWAEIRGKDNYWIKNSLLHSLLNSLYYVPKIIAGCLKIVSSISLLLKSLYLYHLHFSAYLYRESQTVCRTLSSVDWSIRVTVCGFFVINSTGSNCQRSKKI